MTITARNNRKNRVILGAQDNLNAHQQCYNSSAIIKDVTLSPKYLNDRWAGPMLTSTKKCFCGSWAWKRTKKEKHLVKDK